MLTQKVEKYRVNKEIHNWKEDYITIPNEVKQGKKVNVEIEKCKWIIYKYLNRQHHQTK